jgi:hypothetical protein
MKWSAVAISTEFDFISARVQLYRRVTKRFASSRPGLGQRRKVLDQALITSAAATPGVQVHTGVRVDAAGYADPVTRTGMTQALITAEPLTKHLVRRKKVDAAWSRPFEQQRRAILGKWYGTRCYVALTKTEFCPISVGRSRSLVFPRVKFNSGGRPEQTHVR